MLYICNKIYIIKILYICYNCKKFIPKYIYIYKTKGGTYFIQILSNTCS